MRSTTYHVCTFEGSSIFEFKRHTKGITYDCAIHSITELPVFIFVIQFATVQIISAFIHFAYLTEFISELTLFIPPKVLFQLPVFLNIPEFYFAVDIIVCIDSFLVW